MTKKEKKSESAYDGLLYDSQSKTWGFRVIRDGKDVRKKGYATKTEAKEARIAFLAKHKEEKNGNSDKNVQLRA